MMNCYEEKQTNMWSIVLYIDGLAQECGNPITKMD